LAEHFSELKTSQEKSTSKYPTNESQILMMSTTVNGSESQLIIYKS